MTPQQAFDHYLDALDAQTIGVAVSGGSDSMALLVLADDFAKRSGKQLVAATVDHGLRVAAADEAAMVAAFCAARGIAHSTLKWTDWRGEGNLQAGARAARYDLLSHWACRQDADVVLLGHTQDDQAETVLMSLARGSGVDGLAGMSAAKGGVFHRPLLSLRRGDLRAMLQEAGVDWADDPSNDDLRFDRVKARQMMAHLDGLGLTMDRLIQTADHMARAQRSLIAHADGFARNNVQHDGPDLIVRDLGTPTGWTDTEPRVLSAALMWMSGATYRPRFKALCGAFAAVLKRQTRTLHGVQIVPEEGGLRLIREYAACTDVQTTDGSEHELTWDARWVLQCGQSGAVWPAGLTVRALGESLSEVPNWRDAGLRRTSAMATPAVFDADELISAPAVGLKAGFSAEIATNFHSSWLMH